MIYRTYGKLGYQISQFGFGAMRLPKTDDGEINIDASVEAMRKAHELGVNYFDTAYGYGGMKSEVAVGQALADVRKDVFISTKVPVHAKYADAANWRGHIEQQLERMGTDYIDFWNFHDLQPADHEEKVMPKGGLMDDVQKAKEDGLIRHICLSCHQKPETMKQFLDSGCFDGITLQYNILDRVNEPVIEYAHSKGIGVIVMGPVGGGKLAEPSERLAEAMPDHVKSMPELAIRFVMANPHVTCALSGMNSVEMVEENCAAASHTEPLTDEEWGRIVQIAEDMKELKELYCTGCGYCMPCPNDVDIPRNFELMNYFKVHGFTDLAREGYAALGASDVAEPTDYQKTHLRASECVECGECDDKCPQDIEIQAQLKDVAETLAQ